MNSKIVIHGSSYFVQYQSFVEAVYFSYDLVSLALYLVFKCYAYY